MSSLSPTLVLLFRIVRAAPYRWRRRMLKMLSRWDIDARLSGYGQADYRYDECNIRVDLSDFVGREMFKYGWYEWPYVDFIRRTFADKSGVFLDVGANAGNYSLALAPHFGDTFAFEPNPETFSVLDENCRRNLRLRIQPIQRGLSSEKQTLDFYRNDADNSGASGFEKQRSGVEPLSLVVEKGDDVIPAGKRVSAIKIDVEGHELEVIRGLQATIARDRPVVFLEWITNTMEQRGGLAELGALLPPDYRILCSKSRRSITLETLAPPYENKYDMLFCTPAERPL